ncbi:MAG: yheT [Panacagrimonas sp.]|jgi:predicted alpha/beta-fold hydrolase|nr:hydrolase [Panacagrimonas sp.]MCC2656440.1 yheT [Panacagrimonas sp.]
MSPSFGRIVESRFLPHPLMPAPHLQTIAPALLRRTPRLALRVERLDTPDGDFVDLGWAGEWNAAGPIAILVHGLGGGFESKYLLGTGARLAAAGWRVCVLLLRGASPEPNRLDRAYNQGDTADLRHLWRVLRGREPDTFVATVGWSLGGNVTLKALGEEGDDAPVDAACAVSVPFRLRECVEHLRIGFARQYQKRLLDSLKDMVRRKNAYRPIAAPADVPKALAARDFFEFDDAFTAPLNGYRDAEDYYARAACGQFLAHVRRPTLILHALDDPFMVPSVIPAASQLSADVTLELSPRGGHVGFISAGPMGRPVCWSEEYLCRHLATVLAGGRAVYDASRAATPLRTMPA